MWVVGGQKRDKEGGGESAIGAEMEGLKREGRERDGGECDKEGQWLEGRLEWEVGEKGYKSRAGRRGKKEPEM